MLLLGTPEDNLFPWLCRFLEAACIPWLVAPSLPPLLHLTNFPLSDLCTSLSQDPELNHISKIPLATQDNVFPDSGDENVSIISGHLWTGGVVLPTTVTLVVGHTS